MTSVDGEPELLTTLQGSVVIAAHNEATVIVRCLTALVTPEVAGRVEIFVVCNGCTDNTADVVRASGLSVTVIELAQPSKVGALAAADALATAFPRVYLDADVELSGVSLIRVLDVLRDGAVLAGRPPLRYEVDGCSWLVRCYYRSRSRVPALTESLWGAGVYALSESGRSRFSHWPQVGADDLFVDRLFERHEIQIVPVEPVLVRVPRTSATLIRILGRNYRGKGEEAPAAPDGQPANRPTLLHSLTGIARTAVRNPAQAWDALVYAGFAILGRISARARNQSGWARDETSRTS